MKLYLLLFPIAILMGCNNSGNDVTETPGSIPPPVSLNISVLNQFPHDTSMFTEGLEFHNGIVYESGGNKGMSSLIRYELASGKKLDKIKLDANYFGEGITILNNQVYQLTYQEKDVLVYSLNDLQLQKKLRWPREGWGMTNNGTDIFITDGSSNIYVVDPSDFSTKKTIDVVDNNGPVNNLNELEFINGKFYCNRWQTPEILVINPDNGHVESKIDLTPVIQILLSNYHYKVQIDESCPNGIAYNADNGKLIITGKYWPAIFEIKIN